MPLKECEYFLRYTENDDPSSPAPAADRYFMWKEFQGDRAAQFLVLRLVDDSHTAAAESFDDLVAGNPGSNHQRCRACGVRPWYEVGKGRSTCKRIAS
jgi:hypothetical protein